MSPTVKFIALAFTALVALAACREEAKTSDEFPKLDNPIIDGVTERIQKEPGNAVLYFERANLLHRLEMDSMALNDYKKAISLDSTKSHYYSALGDLLFEHKDITGSITWLQKAIQLNPKDPVAHLKIAKMHIILNEYDKAFESINTVLRQDVYNPEGYLLKGIAYKNLKDTAKALSSFQTALNALPTYKEAMMQLGLLYAAQKDPLALKYYDNAFAQDTTDVSPIYNKGMYYWNQEKVEEAKKEFTNAILKDQNYANAFFGMGRALMQQDSLEKARRQFNIVIGTEPDNVEAYFNRGLCSEMMGNKAEAMEDYEQALRFNPDYQPAAEAKKRLGGK